MENEDYANGSVLELDSGIFSIVSNLSASMILNIADEVHQLTNNKLLFETRALTQAILPITAGFHAANLKLALLDNPATQGDGLAKHFRSIANNFSTTKAALFTKSLEYFASQQSQEHYLYGVAKITTRNILKALKVKIDSDKVERRLIAVTIPLFEYLEHIAQNTLKLYGNSNYDWQCFQLDLGKIKQDMKLKGQIAYGEFVVSV